MKDGPFQGDLGRAVLQAVESDREKSKLERNNFRKKKGVSGFVPACRRRAYQP
jgi:hypothetical protein